MKRQGSLKSKDCKEQSRRDSSALDLWVDQEDGKEGSSCLSALEVDTRLLVVGMEFAAVVVELDLDLYSNQNYLQVQEQLQRRLEVHLHLRLATDLDAALLHSSNSCGCKQPSTLRTSCTVQLLLRGHRRS